MNSIELFLQSVCRFVSTEERAKDIRDELQDHISNYIEEYTEEGMSLDEATNEALKQMGDPSMLSEFYKEEPYRYKGVFKIILITIFAFVCIFTKIMDDRLKGSDIGSTFIIVILTILCYICFIFNQIKIHKNRVEFSKKEPIFYIQNYKTYILEEKFIKYIQIFFIFEMILYSIASLFVFSNIFQENTRLLLLETVNRCSYDFIMLLLLSFVNFSNMKSIVYSDGIFAINSFVQWDDIECYRWNEEKEKEKVCYSLEFKFKGKKYPYKKGIKVSSFQINLIDELFSSKNIERTECFY